MAIKQTSLIDGAELDFFKRIQSLIDRETLPLGKDPRHVCGVDASYSDKNNRVVAAATLFQNDHLEETSVYSGRFTFPYISGLFFLHEGPFVVEAVKRLRRKPDLVCFDAHGLAHPRSKGLASICGMVLGIPSIGVAKSLLVGETIPYRTGIDKIQYNSEDMGFVIRTPKKSYWSPGYSLSMKQLERVINHSRAVCLNALEESHRLSRKSLFLQERESKSRSSSFSPSQLF